MKTAISIPDNIFKAADKTAKKLGLSRSHLYTIAIKEFVNSHDENNITKILNEIYEKEDSALDSKFLAAQISAMQKEEW